MPLRVPSPKSCRSGPGERWKRADRVTCVTKVLSGRQAADRTIGAAVTKVLRLAAAVERATSTVNPNHRTSLTRVLSALRRGRVRHSGAVTKVLSASAAAEYTWAASPLRPTLDGKRQQSPAYNAVFSMALPKASRNRSAAWPSHHARHSAVRTKFDDGCPFH
jgi:hypothetical protein